MYSEKYEEYAYRCYGKVNDHPIIRPSPLSRYKLKKVDSAVLLLTVYKFKGKFMFC